MTAADFDSNELIGMSCGLLPRASCIDGNDCNRGACPFSFSCSELCLDSGGDIYPLLPLLIPTTELAVEVG